MANVSRINGLRPVKHIDGSPWNGTLNRYVVLASDATAIFQGDLVKLAATTDAVGTQGVTKFVAGTDSAAVGVACGFSINPLNLNSPQYRAASTLAFVLVADAPDTVFEIQSAVAPTPTDLNSNAQVQDAGGSTVTGQSGETIVSYATTATLPLKVMGASQKVDNDITSANYKVLVSINNHQYSGGTGTAGV
jgi:hypothetical protein